MTTCSSADKSDTQSKRQGGLSRYKTVGILADGGMGRIFEAIDAKTGESLVVKMLLPDVEMTDKRVSRFCRESIILSRLSHPNVVGFVEFGLTSDNHPWLAMERCAGRTLADILDEGRLPWRRAAHIARQIADGLAAVHAAGYVHCDLKPDNIVVDEASGDLVKILDFGVAQLAVEDGGRGKKARFVSGTPSYMSPEHLRGQPLDGRADCYTLGLVLFEMLTGRPPFSGTQAEVIEMQRFEPLPALGVEVPAELEGLLGALTRKDRGHRLPSAVALSKALELLSAPSLKKKVRAAVYSVGGLAGAGVAFVSAFQI